MKIHVEKRKEIQRITGSEAKHDVVPCSHSSVIDNYDDDKHHTEKDRTTHTHTHIKTLTHIMHSHTQILTHTYKHSLANTFKHTHMHTYTHLPAAAASIRGVSLDRAFTDPISDPADMSAFTIDAI